MDRLFSTCCVAMLTLCASSVVATELLPEERNELRERAQALQAERERNPSWDGGTRRVNEPQADAPRDPQQARPQKTRSGRKREPVATKVKRGVKNLPGALVRRR